MKILCIFLLGLSFMAISQEDSVKYDELYAKGHKLSVMEVKLFGIVPSSGIAANSGPTTIKLSINVMSGCDDKFLYEINDGKLEFYQLQIHGAGTDAGCDDSIEYYWSPRLERTSGEVNESGQVNLEIGPVRYWDNGEYKEKYIKISAIATRRLGHHRTGYGYFFEYSDVKMITEGEAL